MFQVVCRNQRADTVSRLPASKTRPSVKQLAKMLRADLTDAQLANVRNGDPECANEIYYWVAQV